MWPILIESEWLTLYSYPFLIGIGWGIAYHAGQALIVESGKYNKSSYNIFMFLLFVCSWVGAKLLFLVSSASIQSKLYFSPSFWFGGGFVFYGGLIGGLFFFLLYSRVFKKFPFEYGHYLLPGLCWGHAIGRLGCFLAGCCYGRSTNTFVAVYLHGQHRHPVQLYECFGLGLLGMIIYRMVRKGFEQSRVLTVYFFGYPALRFILEFYRDDAIRGLWGFGFSPSQWLSLTILLIWSFILVLRNRSSNYKRI